MSDERQTTNESTRDIMRAIQKYYPGVADAINSKTADTARAQLGADQAVSDPYAQLTMDLYKKFGPEGAKTAAGIDDITQQAASARELALATGTGRELVKEADASQRLLDPEFYKSREGLGSAIDEYLKLSAPTANETELETMRRGMGRTSVNPQSGIDSASRALQFGQLGREKINNFGNAIGQVAASMPAMRSNIPAFEIATRRAVGANTGSDRVGGAVQNSGAQNYTMGNNFMGQVGNVKQAEMSKQKSLLENVTGWGEFGGKVIGSVAGGMMCNVAREVYGETAPQWKMFQEWLLNEASPLVRGIYCAYMVKFAKFISDKPRLKKIIRKWMDSKIK